MLEIVGHSKTIDVKVNGEVFKVPTPSALPVKVAFDLNKAQRAGDEAATAQVMLDFFRAYMGDVVDTIPLDDFIAFIEAWNQIGAPDTGESSAS